MKHLLLLPFLLLMACAEETAVDTTVPATVEEAKDTIAVSQMAPQPLVAPKI